MIQTGMGLPSLSEQRLVDCASPECGGPSGDTCTQIGRFFDYVQMNGACSEAACPYTAGIGNCKAASCMPVVPSGFAGNWQRLDGHDGTCTGAAAVAPMLTCPARCPGSGSRPCRGNVLGVVHVVPSPGCKPETENTIRHGFAGADA